MLHRGSCKKLAHVAGFVVFLGFFILNAYAQKTIDLNKVGVNTHWDRWVTNFPDFQEKIRPFRFVRDQAWWGGKEGEGSGLQKTKGAPFNWDYTFTSKDLLCDSEISYRSGYDNLVKLFQDPKAPELLLILSTKNDNIMGDISYDDYYQYVSNVVERYDGDGKNDMPGLTRPIRYFEVGNEIDYRSTGGLRHGYLEPEVYVKNRLVPAYLAAKAANPSSVVMGAGLGMESSPDGSKVGYFNVDYLTEVYKVIESNNGKRNNFFMDKVAIHYYSQIARPDQIPDNIEKVKKVINDFEHRDKPIWVTEFGIDTDQFSEDEQAKILVDGMMAMLNNGVEVVFIYELKDDPVAAGGPGGRYGLYKVSCKGTEEKLSPKKVVQALGIKTEPRVPPPQKPKDKTLIRAKNSIDIFWYQNGKRYHVLNADILNKMAGTPGWGWNLVFELIPARFEKIPQGPEFIAPNNQSEGILIRQQGTDPVYRVEDGKLKHISFDECNRANCWNNIIEVTSEIIDLFNQTPTPSGDFLVCAAGADKIIDDLEIVGILNSWQKQRDYKGCGVPTDDDYMRALGSWIKRQPVDWRPPAPTIDNPPIVTFVTPSNGATVSGITNVTIQINDDFGITKWVIDFGDGACSYEINPPYPTLFEPTCERWNSDVYKPGTIIRITASATDTKGQTATASITVTTKGSPPQDNPPTITIETPGNGATVSGPTEIVIQAQDDIGIQAWRIEITVPNTELNERCGITYDAPPTFIREGFGMSCALWNVTAYANLTTSENATITAMVVDTKGQTATVSVTVTIGSSGQAPQITSIDIPNKLPLQTATNWTIGFFDPDANIVKVQIEQFVSGSWQGAGEFDPGVKGQTQGEIGVATTCYQAGFVQARVSLIDETGYRSEFRGYSFTCVENDDGVIATIILRANYKSECPVCVGDYCYDFPSVKCVRFEWQYGANDVLLFEIRSMYTDRSGYSEMLNKVNPVTREYSEMLTEDKKVCVQVRAQTSKGFTDWSNKVCATIYAITPSSRWQPELSNKILMAKVQIFTLSGQLIYATDFGDSKRLEWDLKDYRNLPIANGVYIAVITTESIYGTIRREVKKIVVLR